MQDKKALRLQKRTLLFLMERGSWATNSTLKNVYQHTFSEERKQVDEMIDRYFEDALHESDAIK